jgi:hypothetical protein
MKKKRCGTEKKKEKKEMMIGAGTTCMHGGPT